MAPEPGTRAGEHLASAIGQGQEGNQGEKISRLVDLKHKWTYSHLVRARFLLPPLIQEVLGATLSQVPQGAKVLRVGLRELIGLQS